MPNTEKAYKNLNFLTGSSGRTVRILCEYEEPRHRFAHQGVKDTIVFFGSARIRPADGVKEALEEATRALKEAETLGDPVKIAHREQALRQAKRAERRSRYYEDTLRLAEKFATWSVERQREGKRPYHVCSGGGPGIMEAANRGASLVPGARSVGLGISLPFEEKVNEYITPELAFEFHYFFMRKYWFAYLSRAMVVMPGGFGTMDEMFEILTLRQTQKIKRRLPMVLFGTEYWDSVMDLDAMVEWGTISESDLLLFHRTDSVDDAFHFLKEALERGEHEDASR